MISRPLTGGAITTSARTSIRTLAPQDELLYCRLFTDERTMRFIAAALSEQRASRDFRIALRAADRDPIRELFYSVRDKVTGEGIGICSIQRIDPVHQRAEVGLMLQPSAQRKGLGKEIIEAITRSALATLPVTEIWAQYAADNEVAASLFRSVGFRPIRHEAAGEDTGHVRAQTWSVYSQSAANIERNDARSSP